MNLFPIFVLFSHFAAFVYSRREGLEVDDNPSPSDLPFVGAGVNPSNSSFRGNGTSLDNNSFATTATPSIPLAILFLMTAAF